MPGMRIMTLLVILVATGHLLVFFSLAAAVFLLRAVIHPLMLGMIIAGLRALRMGGGGKSNGQRDGCDESLQIVSPLI
jgi:hypothetical protein